MGSRLIWDPVPKNSSIASLEQDAHSAPQVGGSFPLILASVAGKSRSQLLHLPLGIWVPSPKGLCHNWQESNPLSPTLLLCPINFALICIGEGMASCVCSTWHGVVLEGGDHSHIQGSIFAPHPVADEDICRATIVAGKEESPLFHRAKACSHSRIEDSIPEVVVAADSFAPTSTAHSMVTKHITLV